MTELARSCPAGFLLLGRTPLAEEPGWAAGIPDDQLRAAAIAGLREQRPTPRQVERAVAAVHGLREIRATLAELGERAQYLPVDVTDADAVRAVLSPHRDRVTGVVHGAGVLADARLTDKTREQVDRVFGPKLDGLFAVLGALDEAALRHLVLFTSVAGLLGNPGQADYAAANEALCRVAASWGARHPDRHVTAIDWGAWDGGMVTPQLRELFAARGVPLLDPRAGARAFVEQFTADRAAQRCVLIGADVSLAGPGRAATAAFTARRDITALADDPVLGAHRIGSHVVLPATFALGWMISVVERAHPGLVTVQVRDFQVYKGIVFDGGERAPGLRVEVGPVEVGLVGSGATAGGTVRVAVRSDGTGTLPTPHYAATLVLAATPDAVATPQTMALPPPAEIPEDELGIYADAVQFHGPALQGLRRVLSRTDERIVVECRLPDVAVAAGAFRGVLHSPVLADLLLQGPPVLGHQLLGRACLPLGIGRADYLAPLPDGEPFVLVLDLVRREPAGAVVTATACAPDGTVLVRFTDVTVVSTPDLSAKFREAADSRAVHPHATYDTPQENTR